VLPISIPSGNVEIDLEVQEEKKMKIRTVLLVGVALLMGRTAFAQEYSKWEIPADYSYARGNGQNIAPFSLNGGGGGIVYNFNRFFGVKGDLQGYGSTTRVISNVSVVNPNGTITLIPQVRVNGNLFTYMGGAQLRLPTHTFKPFAEFLFGGAHTNTYTNLVKATGATVGPNNNAFAMAIGGGFDIRVNKTISIRPFEMDYLLTRFGSSLIPGGNPNQNNFRYNAGVVFTFGE
jgi:Outer membrane protein beta-barrel domain